MNLNELAKQVHAANILWWQDPATGKPIERNKGELLMLAITELSEAVEGIRKDLWDDHIPTRKMEEVEMADAKIRLLDFAAGFGLGTLREYGVADYAIFPFGFTRCENKAASILIICSVITDTYSAGESARDLRIGIEIAIGMIEFYCHNHGLDLEGAIRDKMEFNRTRADHQHEARKLAGGKKF